MTLLPVLVAMFLARPDDIPGARGLIGDADDLAVATPDPAAQARYAEAARYSRRTGGLALLVVDGDRIVFEEAENGFDLGRAHHLWSGTKTFACALALAAEADGLFTLDTTLGAVLGPGAPGTIDDKRAALTVRDLLSLTSGLSESGDVFTRDMLAARPRIADKEAWALREVTAVYAPGERFRYAASAFVYFSILARHALAEDPLAYLERRLFAPIGFRHLDWMRDPAGNAWFSFGAYTTARSWARFGMLLRDDGVFAGRRLLPAGSAAKCFQGTGAMPAYGIAIWLNKAVTPAQRELLPGVLQGPFASRGEVLLPRGPPDLVAAVGFRDNRLYVVPSRGLVVVRFGTGHARFEDEALLSRLFD